MHGVGEDVDLGIPPGNQLAVEPDEAVAIVVGGFLSHDQFLRLCLCIGSFITSAQPSTNESSLPARFGVAFR
jgi:hypothetical protein